MKYIILMKKIIFMFKLYIYIYKFNINILILKNEFIF